MKDLAKAVPNSWVATTLFFNYKVTSITIFFQKCHKGEIQRERKKKLKIQASLSETLDIIHHYRSTNFKSWELKNTY